ncbi:cytochrome c oxidase subunit I [Candidatus Halocynthiibacter alkanivorans]|uniref:cytochrome c oxidase subunit I n=1 Tax=Candidatus Halocynthiibacter alkanivorans TaxID=2267619 RepID=UPI00135BCA58|nr:cbb3-type cytochrome c oxidase subunit I [Candidatus Halocynthiibacter alkanivorans]
MSQEMYQPDAGHAAHWRPRNLIGDMSVKEIFFSNDYRHLALKGMFTSLIMLAFGGMFALFFRAELAIPGEQFLGAKVYMTLMTLHGMFMVFGFLIPFVVSINYYLLPKVLGNDRLLWAPAAQASYWVLIAAALLLVIGRPDFTWTAYAPMATRTGNPSIWMGYVGIILVAVSEFLAGAVLFRNAISFKGGYKKAPLLAWASGCIGLLFMVSVFPLGFVGYGLLSDWSMWREIAYFDPSRGGSVQFFLYVFWTYGHPAVYLPFVPAIAVIYTLMPRLLGHNMWSHWSGVVAFVLLTLGAMPIGPHHFQPLYTISGDYQRFIQILTMLVFIPSVLHVFNWISTLFMSPIPDSARRAVPFKFMVMSIAFIVYGGATAFLNAQIAPDSDFIHNTYWIPAHFHAMFVGFTAQMGIAGFYFLYPYFTGRMFNQKLGNFHFWSWQIGLFLKITGMGIAGYLYFPRWVYDYLDIPGWAEAQMMITVGGYLVGAGFLAFIFNIAWSAKYGKVAADDPWPVIHDLNNPAEAPAGSSAAPAE